MTLAPLHCGVNCRAHLSPNFFQAGLLHRNPCCAEACRRCCGSDADPSRRHDRGLSAPSAWDPDQTRRYHGLAGDPAGRGDFKKNDSTAVSAPFTAQHGHAARRPRCHGRGSRRPIVQKKRFRVSNKRFEVQNKRFGVSNFRFKVSKKRFGVQRKRFEVSKKRFNCLSHRKTPGPGGPASDGAARRLESFFLNTESKVRHLESFFRNVFQIVSTWIALPAPWNRVLARGGTRWGSLIS